jgi:SAM-dependent methyltransferase
MGAFDRIRSMLSGAKTQGRPPGWHRAEVGGEWETIGKLQFDYLVAQGLQPHHNMLDVGCGSMRGGLHFVRYLDAGHYVGFDVNAELLDAGRKELADAGLTEKNATLVQTDTFDVTSLGRTFDFALAQSVFTHLPLNPIIRCLTMMDTYLAPSGRFYATFFENPDGKRDLGPVPHGSDVRVSYFDRDPFHYDVASMEWACSGLNLVCEYIGEWGHPRGQRMLVFRRP